MKIIEYNSNRNIIVEFQDEFKYKKHTTYDSFKNGEVKNPYFPNVYGVGIVGDKYEVKSKRNKATKEYEAWRGMIRRCFDKKFKEKQPTYENVTCCNEWLLYENFYEWLHKQPNFQKWLNGERWAIDKDILNKGNKIYSPETCCLVPMNINNLFVKSDASRRKNLPIGVYVHGSNYQAACGNLHNKKMYIGAYKTPEEAFYLGYKPHKETLIKQVAEIEFAKQNISKQCYDAMINYKVEITD